MLESKVNDRIHKQQRFTKMKAEDLATIWGPVLLRPRGFNVSAQSKAAAEAVCALHVHPNFPQGKIFLS